MGFPIQNVGDMDLLSPVDISDRHVALSNMMHLFSSESSSPCIPLIIKYSIICESLWNWDFRYFFFNCHVFLT